MTAAERRHVTRIKEMDCIVCGHAGPSEAHEPEQGLWHCAIPLCPDCHRGSKNGWHGRRDMWRLKGLDELGALNLTIGRLLA
jgi:hypothetical protein